MRRELSELNRILRYHNVPHTLASAMATVSMVVGFGAFFGRAFA